MALSLHATGYTHKIYDGEQDFASFVRDCAGAFGLLFKEDGTPNLRSVDPSLKENVERLEAEVKRLNAMTLTEAAVHCVAEHHEKIQALERLNAERAERGERIQAMVDKVTAWDGDFYLRSFMLDQLAETYRYDCKPYDLPPAKTASEWLADTLASTKSMLASARARLTNAEANTRLINDRLVAIHWSLR